MRNEFPPRIWQRFEQPPVSLLGLLGVRNMRRLMRSSVSSGGTRPPSQSIRPCLVLEQFYQIDGVERLESFVKEASLPRRFRFIRKRYLSLSLNRRCVGFTPPRDETAGVSIRHHLGMLVMSTGPSPAPRLRCRCSFFAGGGRGTGISSAARLMADGFSRPVAPLRAAALRAAPGQVAFWGPASPKDRSI